MKMQMPIDVAAAELVERARNGDQNAMATLTLVGKQARKEGRSPTSIKARITHEAVMREIRKSKIGADIAPPPAQAPFLRGINNPQSFLPCFMRLWQCKDGSNAIVVALANGPLLNTKRIQELTSQVSGDLPMPVQRTINAARAVQMVRHPKIPIRAFSRDVAWELGE